MAAGESLAPLGVALPPPRDLQEVKDMNQTMQKSATEKHSDYASQPFGATSKKKTSAGQSMQGTMILKQQTMKGSTMFGDDPMGLYGTKAKTRMAKGVNEFEDEEYAEEEEAEYESEEDIDLKKQAY
jgi:hypothetical protein